MQEKGAAYHQLTSRSLTFAARAQALRDVMQLRSGLKEGLDVAVGRRRPVDLLELHDWISKDFAPVNDAWSKIQMIAPRKPLARPANCSTPVPTLLALLLRRAMRTADWQSPSKGSPGQLSSRKRFTLPLNRSLKPAKPSSRLSARSLGPERCSCRWSAKSSRGL